MSLEKVLYTATATATGGREGQARSSDGALSVQLSTPRSCLPQAMPPVFWGRSSWWRARPR